MRKLYLIVLLFAIACNVNAQLSEGGTPPGFKFAPSNRLPVEYMPAFNVDSMKREDSVLSLNKSNPYRFGYNHFVNYGLTNSGTWTTLPNGDRLWQLDVRSVGALSINLAFSHFHMPVGAKLYVYSKDHRQVLGAFTDKQNFADKFFGTELLYTDEVVIEYYEPASVRGQGIFELFRVTHGYRDAKGLAKAFGDSGGCENNINCPQYVAYSNQKRAVVCLVSGGNEFCSGALVNNTLNDGTPYILTANHCGTADGTWVFRFNWEASGCPNPSSNPGSQSITGGTPIAHNGLSDFNLVRMSTTPPANYNVFYAGWDHSGIPATSVTGIHHPQGDIKKCSQASNAVSATSQDEGNGPAQCWQIGTWTDGVTESGSSGSPLFDQNKRIIGQLYGGPSYCGATGSNLTDFYGRFAVSWDTGSTAATRLHDWLDPNNSGAITNDGYDPNIAQYSLDPSVSNISSPYGQSCNTTVDPVFTFINHGTDTITSLTVSYHIDNTVDSVYNWTGVLTSLQSATINLPALTTGSGIHTLYVSISNPNQTTDQNTSNDSTQQSFTVITPTPVSLPLFETFSGSGFPPTGWTVNNPDNDNTWERNTAAGGFGQSSGCADVDQFSPNGSTQGEIDDLITPFLDFSNVSAPAYLSFDVANAKFNNYVYDSLLVLATTDCGNSYIRLYAKGGNGFVTAPATTNKFVPSSTQWRRDSINISGLIGQPNVKFLFELKSGWANMTYIDNVNIYGAIALDAGINHLQLPNDTLCSDSVSATFVITNSGHDTLQQATVYYQLDGGGVSTYNWSGSLANGHSDTVSLSNITTGTGAHTLTVYSSQPNGGADNNHSNDTVVTNFVVSAALNTALQLPQDTFCNNAGVITLTGGTPAGGTYSGTGVSGGSFYATQSGPGTYPITYTYVDNTCSQSASANVVVEVCSGISDVEQNLNVQVYPNPFNEGFNVQFELQQSASVTAQLYAIDGRVVQEILHDNNLSGGIHQLNINTSLLSSGVYFLKLNNSFIKVEKAGF